MGLRAHLVYLQYNYHKKSNKGPSGPLILSFCNHLTKDSIVGFKPTIHITVVRCIKNDNKGLTGPWVLFFMHLINNTMSRRQPTDSIVDKMIKKEEQGPRGALYPYLCHFINYSTSRRYPTHTISDRITKIKNLRALRALLVLFLIILSTIVMAGDLLLIILIK